MTVVDEAVDPVTSLIRDTRYALVVVVHMAMMVLNYFVFPLERFGQNFDTFGSQVTIITLNLALLVIFTYLFLIIADENKIRVAIIQSLLFLNLLTAAVVVKIPYYALGFTITILIVSLVLPSIKEMDDPSFFGTFTIVPAYAIITLMWLVRDLEGIMISLVEFYSFQIVLALLLFLKKFRPYFDYLFFLSMISMNLLVMVPKSGRIEEWIIPYATDLSLVVIFSLAILMVANLGDLSSRFRSLTGPILAVLILLYSFDIRPRINDLQSIGYVTILGIDITLFAVLITSYSTILLIRSQRDDQLLQNSQVSILLLTGYLTFMNIFPTNVQQPYASHLALAILLFVTNIHNLIIGKSNSPLVNVSQAFVLLSMLFMSGGIYTDWVQSTVVIIFFIYSVVMMFRVKNVSYMEHNCLILAVFFIGNVIISHSFIRSIAPLAILLSLLPLMILVIVRRHQMTPISTWAVMSAFSVQVFIETSKVSSLFTIVDIEFDFIFITMILVLVTYVLTIFLSKGNETLERRYLLVILVLSFVLVMRSMFGQGTFVGNYYLELSFLFSLVTLVSSVLLDTQIRNVLIGETLILVLFGYSEIILSQPRFVLFTLVLYSVFVIMGYFLWNQTRDDHVAIAAVCGNMILALCFNLFDLIVETTFHGYFITFIGVILFSVPLLLSKARRHSIIHGAIIILTMLIIPLSNDIPKLETQGSFTLLGSTLITPIGYSLTIVFYLLLSGFLLGYWLLKRRHESIIPELVLVMTLFFALINVFFVNPVPTLFLILVLLITVYLSQRLLDSMDLVYPSVVISILLFYFDREQVQFLVDTFDLSIAGLSYLGLTAVFLANINRLTERNLYLSILSLGALSIFLVIIPTSEVGVIVIKEVIAVVILISFLLLPLLNKGQWQTIAGSLSHLTIFFLFLVTYNTKLFFRTSLFDVNAMENIIFAAYTIIAFRSVFRTDSDQTWQFFILFLFGNISVLSIFATSLAQEVIGLSIISASILPYLKNNRVVKNMTAIGQAFALFFLSFSNTSLIRDLPGDLTAYALFLLLWVVVIYVVWYRNGISSQLSYNMGAIFLLAALLCFRIFFISDFLLSPGILIASLLISSLVSLKYYSQVTSVEYSILVQVFIITIIAMILTSNFVIVAADNSTIELYLRLILDWLIFTPIVVLSTLVLISYVEIQGTTDPKKADVVVISVLILLLISSFLMGAVGLFGLKLLVIAISFWVFTSTFVHNYLAWATSLNTAFTAAYLLAQVPSSGDPDLTSYFLAVAAIGVLMVIAAMINEMRYYGEPLTASLSITGGSLTSITIFAPLLVDSPFPGVSDELSEQLINFLPNITWAILGLLLFLFSLKYSKSYLRRYSLSILLVDVLKTGSDILRLENDLIRIVGSMVLGAVLILVFFLFTSEETQEDNSDI